MAYIGATEEHLMHSSIEKNWRFCGWKSGHFSCVLMCHALAGNVYSIWTGTMNRGASWCHRGNPGLGNLIQVWEQNRGKGVRYRSQKIE